MPRLDVICVGSATLDTIAVVPAIPGEDERAVASAFDTAGGGPAATAAVALARLGARVGFCGVVGDDEAGRAVRAGLEHEGVDVTWLETRAGVPTTRACVLVSERTSGRTIVVQPGSGPDATAIPVDASSWLHVDHLGFAPTMVAVAHRPGHPRISVDAGNPLPSARLRDVDLYAPTLERLRERYPRASTAEALGRAALVDGAGAVVATDGARGASVTTPNGFVEIPPFTVEVTSTLGAGDVFHGALLAFLVSGCDLVESATRASAVAAMSCRALDGRSAIPTRAQLDAFLAPSAIASGA